MNRKQADIVAGALIATILLVGVLSVIQLHLAGGPMGGDAEPLPVIGVFGPLFMSLVIASIIGGVYVYVRNQVFTIQTGDAIRADVPGEPDAGTDTGDVTEPATGGTDGTQQPDATVQRRILDVLPDDERRILEPVIESPGLTQIKVRDRSGFSRSKVSQTITDLEERGLLYRESQGRTYRVYPADDLDERI